MLHAPPKSDRSKPVPVVLVFHGGASNAEQSQETRAEPRPRGRFQRTTDNGRRTTDSGHSSLLPAAHERLIAESATGDAELSGVDAFMPDHEFKD